MSYHYLLVLLLAFFRVLSVLVAASFYRLFLLLLKWTDMKQTAAISALFIFVNSLAGLAGQLQKGIHFSPDMYGYVAIAFAGGICGAYFGSLKFKSNILKYMLAVVLMVAAYKLLFTNA